MTGPFDYVKIAEVVRQKMVSPVAAQRMNPRNLRPPACPRCGLPLMYRGAVEGLGVFECARSECAEVFLAVRGFWPLSDSIWAAQARADAELPAPDAHRPVEAAVQTPDGSPVGRRSRRARDPSYNTGAS